jgi:D-tyrosyl-tRNA(Tyr) deacylase
MKAVIQRVSSASVTVADKKISEIGFGLLILLGITQKDEERDIDYLVKKTAGLRIFKDEGQKMNLSIQDVGGEILVVSQFTLCADTRKGRRPAFVGAAKPNMAENMYDQYCQKLQLLNIPVSKGQFGASMDVELINDGPVTIILDSREDIII